VRDSAGLLAVDQELDEKDLDQIPKVLRFLMSAINSIKLYPQESILVCSTIESFRHELKRYLARHPALTLAWVGNSLLANGQKFDAAEFKAVTDCFLKLMQSLKLRSISFLETFDAREVQAFVRAIGNGHADSFDSLFWQRLANKQHISGILFDQNIYRTLEDCTGFCTALHVASAEQGQIDDIKPAKTNSDAVAAFDSTPVEERPAMPEVALKQEEVAPLTADQLESVTVQMIDMLFKGDEKQVRGIIHRLFKDFAHQTCEVRTRIIKICCDLLENMICGSQPLWALLLIDSLLLVLKTEDGPEIRNEMIGLLSRTAASLIQFGDYQLASRIFFNLRKHQKQWQDKSNGQDQVSGATFPYKLEMETRMLLKEDFKSREAIRIRRAARLLSSLGPASMPMLVEVIKEEENIGGRQIACRLLKEFGSAGGKLLKRDLMLDNSPAERVRILEVIDIVTRDLYAEMALSLDDENPEVRRAALRLAERMNDSQAISVLLEFATHENRSLATAAIHTLGKLGNPAATEALVGLLNEVKNTDRLIACCRAAARQAHPTAIRPLANIMARMGFLSMRKKNRSSLRVNAAYALAQIQDTHAAGVLAGYVDDRDLGVRRIARARVSQPEHSSPVARN
jgi:HEAT repeat protein